MDQSNRIKELVRDSLDTSFGGGVLIDDMVVLPTHKYDDILSEWIPDSYTIFLSIKKTTDPKMNEESYGFGGTFIDQSKRITDFLEGFLGYEVCVDVV